MTTGLLLMAGRYHNRCLMRNRGSSTRHHLRCLLELTHIHGSFVFVNTCVIASIWHLFFVNHHLAVFQSNLSYLLLIVVLEALIEWIVSWKEADLITLFLSDQIAHLRGSWWETPLLLFLFLSYFYWLLLLLLVSLAQIVLIQIHLLNIVEQWYLSSFFLDH